MARELKRFFDREVVRDIARAIARVHPPFPERAFVAEASAGLAALELLDRGRHIAAALGRHLPASYPEAVEVLVRSLGPEHTTDELEDVGMAPFLYLPHTIFVAERGLDDFEPSMRAQYQLTKRFTAEFSIRPFIARDPERTLAVLRGWASDPDPHVRRLVSEGTRLRLPWGTRVAWLDANPRRVLALLELLRDDASPMVRRSVANNLNDLGKVHPALLVETCARWLDGASSERRALVEHALRSAVKRGEAGALRLLGYGRRPSVAVEDVRLEPPQVVIGGHVRVSFSLRSTARSSQDLLVDLAVHFVKASGRSAPKVFKLQRVALPARASVQLDKRISLAVHTTRTPRPGRHAVDVVVNGHTIRAGTFEVVADRRGAAPRRSHGRPGG